MSVQEINGAAPGRSSVVKLCNGRWEGRIAVERDPTRATCRIVCPPTDLPELSAWLMEEAGYTFATLITEQPSATVCTLTYVFYGGADPPWVHVSLTINPVQESVPSIVELAQGPAVDWHEREVEDLFGVRFEGHPRLGDFVLHEDWPEGVKPMRPDFDATRPRAPAVAERVWQPPTIVTAPGSFAMPIGPVFADFAESAHFLLETVGEDVIRTIPRFFYNYRGVEKIAEGAPVDRVLLLAERFSGTAAFAHALGFCQAIETICDVEVPPRAEALRTLLAELERLRHHAATITGICHSTALVVATAQASLIEEDLLRMTAALVGHRYLFGAVAPGGLTRDLGDAACRELAHGAGAIAERLARLNRLLRYSSSFLDRLEGVGIVSGEGALAYGLVGPVGRASGMPHDMRKLRPYAAYDAVTFSVPIEQEGDGYARLRVFFEEAAQAAAIIRQIVTALREGPTRAEPFAWRAGAALGIVEAPSGAAFHWVRLSEDGTLTRYRVMPPAFTNWHGFHLAAENFAFQDFPIILASFGLSNAECDR
jgi:formate hydrogenlyase subunit 5